MLSCILPQPCQFMPPVMCEALVTRKVSIRRAKPVVIKFCAGAGRCVDSVSANERRSVFNCSIEGSGSCAGWARR